MICKNCKSNLEEGMVLCPSCGKPVQIVPDYNLLDDEALTSLIDDGSLPRTAVDSIGHTQDESSQRDDVSNREKTREKYRIFAIVGVIGILLIGVFALLGSSFMMVSIGNKAYSAGDYSRAMDYYGRALVKKRDPQTLALMGKACAGAGDLVSAEDYLRESLAGDPENSEVYESILSILSQEQDTDGIRVMETYAITDEQKRLFSDYLISSPVFSVAGGEYSDDVKLKLTCVDGFEIYYTVDGTEPDSADGSLYKRPIKITDGTTTVKACCKNPAGRYSQVIEETYSISYVAPSFPVVSPMTGEFHSVTRITIVSPIEDGEIYYTWNGSDPTVSSYKYTAPITVPEGDHILSVIVIDHHGLSSDVLRCSYSYIPAAEPKESSGDE